MVDILLQLRKTGIQIQFKAHPSHAPLKEFNTFNIIDRVVPAELIMGSAKVIIGVSTLSLKAKVSSIRISAVKLLGLPNHFINQTIKTLGEEVLYPSSLEEFQSLIAESLKIRLTQ